MNPIMTGWTKPRRATLAIAAALLAAAPALAQAPAMNPAQAIVAATASGQVEGVFEFDVVSTGASGFLVFLNSAADYRDATNLAAELQPAASTALRQKLGGHPDEKLKGKRVRITGVARRVPIPRRDGTQYFQTRIDVTRADQIQILG